MKRLVGVLLARGIARFDVRFSVLAWAVALVLGSSSGCGDSLVGLQCRDGYSTCGRACYDLQNDPDHCGSCDNSCESGEICSEGSCTGSGAPDAGLDAGDAEAGEDGGTFADVELPPICTGPGSPPDCICGLGQLICDSTCVDALTDDKNCGECGKDCNMPPPPSGRSFCVGGVCQPNCDPPLLLCGGACIEVDADPMNCGGCGVRCASGLCDMGMCLDATAGHVIVIGHDLSAASPAAKRLSGNAIFLPSKQKVRGLVYEERSSAGARAGVQSVIDETQALTGRMFDRTTATSALSVPFLLAQADVFVIVAQANATNEVLIKNGDTWSRALQTFVARGGVVVLFDGGGSNAGTYQLLQQGGLFTATARVNLSPRTVNVVAASDALASFVPTRYQAMNFTVGFETTETIVVVRDTMMSGLPVVIHIAR
jgi:hypothetical protein